MKFSWNNCQPPVYNHCTFSYKELCCYTPGFVCCFEVCLLFINIIIILFYVGGGGLVVKIFYAYCVCSDIKLIIH